MVNELKTAKQHHWTCNVNIFSSIIQLGVDYWLGPQVPLNYKLKPLQKHLDLSKILIYQLLLFNVTLIISIKLRPLYSRNLVVTFIRNSSCSLFSEISHSSHGRI